MMNKKELEAFTRQAAKSIKSEADFNIESHLLISPVNKSMGSLRFILK